MYQIPNIDSKFRLVLLAAKRAKQIINGDKKRVDIKAENPLTIALEEIIQNKITIDDLAAIEHIIEEKQTQAAENEAEPDLAQILANMSSDSPSTDFEEEAEDFSEEEE